MTRLWLKFALAGPGCWLAGDAVGETGEVPGRSFNLRFISNGQGADLAEFLRGSSVAAGLYRVDIYLNQALSGRRDVEFRASPGSGKVEPCLNRELLQNLGVDLDRLIENARLPAQPEQHECLSLPALIDQASAAYQADTLRLDLSVPQLALRRSAKGYVDPALWDAGVPVGFINYSLNATHSEDRGYAGQRFTDRYFLGLRNGINLGEWRLRNEGSLAGPADAGQGGGFGGRARYRSNRSYAQHDLDAWRGQLTLGESYSPAQIFDSVRFRGVQVATDEGMLPDSERGYAPVVRGIAQSHATVEVRQNDFLVYSARVAPGPFEIPDLGSNGSNGDLQVTVIEADGRRRSYTQAFSTPPLMLRNGALRYSLTGGEYASNTDQPSPGFASGTLAYGLSDALTGFGGVQWAEGYQALNLGVGLNTAVGAISFDATQADSLALGERHKGQSLRLQYSTLLSTTHTRLNLATYRYSSVGYRSFADHVADTGYLNNAYRGARYANDRVRDRLVVGIDQRLGPQRGTFYLQASAFRYWQKNGRSVQWQMGYNHRWGSLSYSLNAAWSDAGGTADVRTESDRQVSLEVSWPLGEGARTTRASSTFRQRGSAGYSSAARLSGYLPFTEDSSFLLEAGAAEQSGAYGAASVITTTSVGRFNAGYDQGGDYRNASLGAVGSMVVHEGGVNFGQSLSDTFALVEVQRVAGVGLTQFRGVETAANGFAVVPNAQPYRLNWIGLDTRKLGAGIEIANSVAQVVPRRGSATVVHFVASQGRRVQFELSRADGSTLPLGAMVEDETGQLLAMVDPTSRALVLSQQSSGMLRVRWSDGSCEAPFVLPALQAGRNYLDLAAVCQ